MTSLLVRAIISLAVILAASELGRRFSRVGGFVLSLPLAFAPQLGLGFWQALAGGIVLAAVTTAIGLFVAA